jgi:hypothetical protein
VFAILIVALFIFCLCLKKKSDRLHNAVLPLFLSRELEYPKSRSKLIRSFELLEDELSTLFQCKVKIQFSFYETLFFLVTKNFKNETCFFSFEGQALSAKEIFKLIDSNPKKKTVWLSHSGKKLNSYWMVKVDDK